LRYVRASCRASHLEKGAGIHTAGIENETADHDAVDVGDGHRGSSSLRDERRHAETQDDGARISDDDALAQVVNAGREQEVGDPGRGLH